MNWYLQPWRKYATFTGRAGRTEFWVFYLANILIGAILSQVGNNGQEYSPVELVFYLAILLPSLAVAARRLHDIGRSGWWQLLSLIPVVGSIALLVMCVLPGHEGANKFGNPPVRPAAA